MRADRYIYGQNARRPRPIDRPPKPLPDEGEEEETNVPNQRGYLPAPLPGDRACRPSVPNLYMAAKTKLKLFERASLRLFTKQTTGTPPSFPAKVKTLGYYPTKTFKEDMLQFN